MTQVAEDLITSSFAYYLADIDRRLFEITDPEVIRKLGASLEGNRLSRLWGYGRNKKRIEGLRYYTSFLEKFDIDTAREKNNTLHGKIFDLGAIPSSLAFGTKNIAK